MICLEKFSIGDVVTGVVTGIENYGIFIVLDDKSSGLIHISEISDSYVSNVFNYANVGERINAKIIGIDCNGHYKLSIKAIESENSNINKIKETRNGAVNLFKRLDDWIDFSLDEIEKNNKNL